MSRIVDCDTDESARRDAKAMSCCHQGSSSSKPRRRIVRCLKRSLPWIQKKVPLQTLDICRRCRHALYKLKTDLQELGLSRRQVHRGLIQLATKPRVVLIRQQISRRYDGRLKKLFLENEEEEHSKDSTSCTNDSALDCSSQQKVKDAQKSDTTETGATEETECNQRPTHATSSDVQESVISSKSCHIKSNDTSTSLHPFDKALEQLDKIVSSKMNALEKSVSKRSSVIVSANSTSKLHNKNCASNKCSSSSRKSICSENKNQRAQFESGHDEAMRKTPDLVADRVGINIVHVPCKDKRHKIKLNLSSYSKNSKERADIVKSNVNRRLDGNEKTAVNVEADSVSFKIRCHSEENDRSRVTSQDVSEENRSPLVDAEVTTKEDNALKRRSHEEIKSDHVRKRKKISASFEEVKKSNETKRKRVKTRFRVYFGANTSISEDEQEEDILCKKFKRRRKKDSVDSCDSGVCTTESNVSNCIEILKEFQKAVPDLTVQEEFGEDTYKISSKTEEVGEARNVNKDESVETIDQVKNIESVTKTEIVKNVVEADSIENIESVIEVENIEIVKNCIKAGTTKNTADESTENVEHTTNAEMIEHARGIIKVGSIENVTEMENLENIESYIKAENTENTEDGGTKNVENTEAEDTENVENTEAEGRKNVENTTDAEIVEHTRDLPEMESMENVTRTIEKTHINTCKIDSDQTVTAKEIQEILVDTSDGGNCVKIVTTTDASQTPEETERSEVDVLQMEVEAGNVQAIVTEESSKSQQKIIDYATDLGDLLQMALDETCQITSSGNVISIQESIEKNTDEDKSKEDIDENSNLKVVIKTQSDDNQGLKRKEGVRDSLNDINKSVLLESERSSVAEKEDTQQPKVPLPKLRVLSSIELGSRWCPTPVNPTTIPQSLYNTTTISDSFLQTTAATATTTASILSNLQSQTSTTTSTSTEKIVSPDTIEACISKIEELSASLSTSSLPPNVDGHYLLQMEFAKLCKLLEVNYIPDIRELIRNPSFWREYLKELKGRFASKTTSSQTTYQNAQSVHTTSVQTGTQNSASAFAVPNQCPLNLNQAFGSVSSTQLQQEKATLQPKNNLTQNGAATNPMVNPLFTMQQSVYRIETQRPLLPQQKTSQAYVSTPRLPNVYTVQGVLVEPVVISAVTDQSKKQNYASNTNASFMDQQYNQQNIYVTQANTSVTNRLVQQNVNSAQLNQQQNVNSVQLNQQQNVNSVQLNQQQNVNSAQLNKQQNVNSVQLNQQQNVNSVQLNQQQNVNSAQLNQQQNVNSVQLNQQQNVNSAQLNQQQNVNSAQLKQQQNVNSVQLNQQQNVNSAQLNQQQNVNPAQLNQQQNVNSAQLNQQQNINLLRLLQQPNVNSSRTNQQKAYFAQRIQQRVNSAYMAQQQNIDSAFAVQQQNISSAYTVQQQNMNPALRMQPQIMNLAQRVQPQIMIPAQRMQQQNINPTYRVQQQNTNRAQRMQQQNTNPAQRMQQENTNPAQRMQQQNMNSAQRVQQQNMNSAQRVQQQTINSVCRVQQQSMNSAQRVQQQNMNSAQRVQPQNMNPALRVQQQNNTAQRIQQQSVNITYVPQQQIINPTIGIQQQNINPASQEFQKSAVENCTYNMTQGIVQTQSMPHLPQNTQQSVPVLNYRTQTAQNVFVKIAPQVVPKNLQQNEQIHQKVRPEAKMKMSTNFGPEQTMPPPPPYTQTVHSSEAESPSSTEKKQDNAAPISWDSTTKQFNILKFLSDIQKLMLKEHIEFYFNCTTWLGEQFTMEKWKEIWAERAMLNSFRTLLKHIVEKTVKDLQNKCQENTAGENLCMDIKIGAPKKLCIIVEENNGLHCQVKVSTSEQGRCETVTLNQCTESCQENVNIIEKQAEKQQEATDDLQNKQSPDKIHLSKIDLQKEKVTEKEQNKENLPKDKLNKETPLEAKNNSVAMPSLETQTSNNNETHQDTIENDSESSIELCNMNTEEKNLSESEETIENTVRSDPKRVVASDSNESNKDTIQLPTTQLVTVEISPNNDQVKVIDVNTTCETEDTVIKIGTDKLKENEQKPQEELHSTCTLPSLEKTTDCEPCTESTPGSPDDDIKHSIHTDSPLLEENLESHIADVRSISLETFEKMEGSNNQSTTITEGNIEEEEIKICLRCSKPSTVACSICLEAKYCSKECSDLHWLDEHYKTCIPVEIVYT